jgi:chitin elicitor receptor kinase 1
LTFLSRYAQYGDVSSKIDVYAFGVVLYELISAKEAVVKTNEFITESMGLVALVVTLSINSLRSST